MTEIDDDIQAVVEATELPPRLKNQVYDAVEARDGVTPEQADEIATAVEHRYLESRVDPLDPVGTVSAQSIGEPGTQMSLPADEEVLVREDGETRLTDIGPYIDSLMEDREIRKAGEHEVALAQSGIEVLSLGTDEKVRWKPVEEISRHETPDELLEITLESGRSIRATKNHSFVTRINNEVTPIQGSELESGDWLPVVGRYSVSAGTDSIDLREYLSAEDYWFTSTLTDGGVLNHPGGADQVRNKRAALDRGDLDDRAVYPVQGTVGLPERFPLDEETGFFIGAWLAEGSVTEYFVSLSNIDPEFQDRIRSFASRFDLSVNEYENTSGFAESYDIRVNGKVLAEFLRVSCTTDDGKKVPEFTFGASDKFVKGLLAGYFSGDGNIGSNSVRASSTSNSLIVGIGLLLTRFGVYSRFGSQEDSRTLRVPKKHVPRFARSIGMVGERGRDLQALAAAVNPDGPDATDQIPGFGQSLIKSARAAGIPTRQVNAATKRQRIGRSRLERFIDDVDEQADVRVPFTDDLEQAIEGDVVWERIESIEAISSDHEYVYDFSVEGLETFTTGEGVVTHNTMNTFHYAGVAEIDVTQGLPRLIELVDARKEPDTPMMTVYLDDDHATDREKAHEVVWKIEATRILALGDISTNVADMLVRIDLNEQTLDERGLSPEEIAETIEGKLGVAAVTDGGVIEFGPEEPSYRDLLQLVEQLREIVFKGIDDISRVVIRKEQREDEEDEFVLYTEGSDFGTVMDIDGVDATRTTTNNIHEIYSVLGVEAARESIIEETMNTLEEQGLDDVNVRHLMLVSDIMTTKGTIESIGRHGISGSKESVLARAAFEVTVNHLLDAAVHGEIDDLNGVTENVIVGKPIKLGTGDVDLRMRSKSGGSTAD